MTTTQTLYRTAILSGSQLRLLLILEVHRQHQRPVANLILFKNLTADYRRKRENGCKKKKEKRMASSTSSCPQDHSNTEVLQTVEWSNGASSIFSSSTVLYSTVLKSIAELLISTQYPRQFGPTARLMTLFDWEPILGPCFVLARNRINTPKGVDRPQGALLQAESEPCFVYECIWYTNFLFLFFFRFEFLHFTY